jgi:2-iminobutanoate/2-iminopropanoate deaminase
VLSEIVGNRYIYSESVAMKKIITTREAPEALGPYSQGVQSGNWLFVSGQLGLDPSSKKLVSGNVETETEQVLKNVESIVRHAGMTLLHVVKVTVYLTDLAYFDEMNAAYEKFFPVDPPSRATVPVRQLPKNARIEIECIACGEQ